MASAIDPAVIRRAAEWMARLWSGEASAEDQAACAHWRAAHPDHERAWNRLQAVEHKLASVPGDVAMRTLREPAAEAYQTRRRALQVLGLGLAAGGFAHAVRGTDQWQIALSEHSTGTGEVKTIALPDGTRVVLASASAVDVRFDTQERVLVLRAGEILVTTAPDPMPAHRPFRVQGRHGMVQALGTRFTVRQDADASRVAVFEGAVEVYPGHRQHSGVRIGAGKSASFSNDRVGPPEAAQESSAAWSTGLLVAENMRVADFIAELARYRPGVLRCDPAIADLRVSGVFSLRDTDRALRNLALGLPVVLVHRTRYWVTVRAS